jgi:acyl-CoA synthetase (AMP-forming)/AMP-acid ligase II
MSTHVIDSVKSLSSILHEAAHRTPERLAVVEFSVAGGTGVTYAELHAVVRSVVANCEALRAEGAPVVLVLDNTVASCAVVLGFLLASIDVLCLEGGSSHLVDRDSAMWKAEPAAVVEPRDYAKYLRPAAEAPRANTPRALPSVLQFTSGSTGEPAVVRHPLSNILLGAGLYRDIHGYRGDDIVVLPLPAAHSFGFVGGLFATLMAGAELRTVPAFSLSAVHHAIADGTVALGTPLLYRMLAQSAGDMLPAAPLRVLLSSGGPLPAEVAERVERLAGIPVRQVYGSTETGLIACQTTEAASPGSVGMFAPGVEWALVRTQPDDSARRLLVRTSTMFTGYAGAPLAAGTYYDTGDAIEITDGGEVYVLGRKDRFVNVGGRKVNPRRVERIIREHATVEDVHVFGRTADGEESVHAAVEAVADATPNPEEIIGFCRTRLASHEVPRRVHVLPELPRSSLGKVMGPAVLSLITEKEVTS